MEPRRIILLLLLVIGILSAGYWFYDQPVTVETDNELRGDTPPLSQSQPEQSLENFRLVETTESGDEWILESPSAERFGDTVNLQTPKVRYVTDNETRAVITADQGQYTFRQNKLRLTGNVTINRTQNRQRLLTEALEWSMREDVLRTRKSVRMILPRGTLRARGMKVDLRKETLQFLSSVKISSE